MKKKLILIPLLVLVLILSMGMPVLAWDEEDTLVADNEDFLAGGGIDDGIWETHSGAQTHWAVNKPPTEGYNLYRDDKTDTGNLDEVSFWTFTPDKIDLTTQYPMGIFEIWGMSGKSPDTWYWATEPRGIDYPEPELVEPKREKDPNRFSVLMPFGRDGTRYVSEDDNTLRSSIEVDGEYADTQYMLVIPEGCVIERPTGKRLFCLFLKEIDGDVLTFTVDNVEFSEPCVLYTVEGGQLSKDRRTGEWIGEGAWVEVGTFTSIVGREAHLD